MGKAKAHAVRIRVRQRCATVAARRQRRDSARNPLAFTMSFSNMKLHPSLLSGVKELGFTTPTPIQADAIPPAVEGRDVLACAMKIGRAHV